MYIFLKKHLGIDIAESFSKNNAKVMHMLEEVNLSQFNFEQGCINCNTKKIELSTFLAVASEEIAKKE